MKTVGIICEYNPFHLGHLRQFRLVREKLGEDAAIVCVMSGNFLQRGVPAMWDKYARANAAVACGADLVLELPVTKVLQSAEGFARGGVEILSRLGCVDNLCFGAECGDAEKLMLLAEKLDTATCRQVLLQQLDKGLSYAAARQIAAEDSEDLLSRPNNILGLEYCRAIRQLGSRLIPVAVTRNGDYHAACPDREEPSATAVRAQFPDGIWKELVPAQAADYMTGAWYSSACGERAVLARLRALTDEDWQQCAHGSEGLWSKAMKASRSACSVQAIMAAVKSKRYPMTRVQRLLLCAYLGITQNDLQAEISYCRVLAASDTGRTLLRQAKQHEELPLVNPGQTPADPVYYGLETRCADLFTLFCAQENTPCRTEQDARLSLSKPTK